jgi:methylase of polypeptide subunit release factors
VSIGIDINPSACAVARRTAAQNGQDLDIIRSDLLTSLKRVYGKVDILLFNPPYVPTGELEWVRSATREGAPQADSRQIEPDTKPQGNRRSMGWRRGRNGID